MDVAGPNVAAVPAMFTCPDCSPDELMPLQLAAHARGVLVGLVSLALVLVFCVVVAGACLRYTRRLLLGGATLLGVGVGTLLLGAMLQTYLPAMGIVPGELTGSLARRAEWLWRGDFQLYGWAAIALGMVIVTTEARNVHALTRNRLVPGGVIVGFGLVSTAASVWVSRTFEPLSNTGVDADKLMLVLMATGAPLLMFGIGLVVSVLRHKRLPAANRMGKRVARHAH